MRWTDKSLAYALLRVAFGVNFLGHGAFRILSGVSAFVTATAGHMTKSPLPPALTSGFLYTVPWIEALLGVALILGLGTRIALIVGALFMMALTIGVTSNQQWDVAGQQLLYSLIFSALLFLREHNLLSVDARMGAPRPV